MNTDIASTYSLYIPVAVPSTMITLALTLSPSDPEMRTQISRGSSPSTVTRSKLPSHVLVLLLFRNCRNVVSEVWRDSKTDKQSMLQIEYYHFVIASASAAAPRLHLLWLLLPDCVRFSCCSPIASALAAAFQPMPNVLHRVRGSAN